MKRSTLFGLVVTFVLVGSTTFAQAPARPKLYIEPVNDGFEVYLAAAMTKKSVPVIVVTRSEGSSFTLKASSIEEHQVSTGHKVLNCMFAYCGGNLDKANTSVQLITGDGVVLWSYSVNKGRGEKNRQALAEAIAKHLNDEYIKKQK